jgi:hypothetical protein
VPSTPVIAVSDITSTVAYCNHVPDERRTLNSQAPVSAKQPRQVTTLSPPLGQFVINTILQIAAFAVAIAFGIYAVKSVTVGSDVNR